MRERLKDPYLYKRVRKFRKVRLYAVFERANPNLVLGWVRGEEDDRWAVAEPVHGMAKGRERYVTRREAAEGIHDH